MLDVAAGTGHVARAVRAQVRAVVAVDATEAMLEAGWIEAKRAALRNVVFMQADAAALPFVDGSFDVVVSRFAVHHFEDPAVQIGEMRRVPAPRRPARGRRPDQRPRPGRSPSARTISNGCATPRTRGCCRSTSWPSWWAGTTSSSATSSARSSRGSTQTHTTKRAADQIRKALQADLEGGPATGFRPRDVGGDPRFMHTMASVIASGTPVPAL